jgi:hypothetical protein
VHGELATLGIKVAPSTVWEILKAEGIDPAPQRGITTWADFLRSQAETLLACDFIETVTLTGQRQYILAIIEHANRRIRILGTTTHPTAGWVAQAIKNLVMDLEDAGCRARYLIRDRDGKFPAIIDEVLADAGIQTVLCGVRVPRMNAIMERWVQSCRHELLDRTLIWNERHLRHALHQYEQFYNTHRSHQAMMQSRTPTSCPRTYHGSRTTRPPGHTPPRPTRRCPPRIPTCRLSCTDEILGRRSAGADPVAEANQFSLDPPMSPARVIPSQPPNKITYFVADTWAARKVRIRPVPADQATVPGQQRARRDDAMLPQLAGKPADQGGQHGPVRPGQTWPGNLATQHRDLMAQHHQLSDYRGLATRHLRQPAEYPNRSQVQQPNNHGPDPAPPAAKRQPTPCANSSGTVQACPHGRSRLRVTL